MSVRAEADPAYPAGHALIRVAGAAAVAGTPGFRVQRDAGWGDDKLGPGGWQGSDALLQPDRAEASGSGLLLHVGWTVCQHLEAGVYEFSLPAAGLAQVGLSWPHIVPQYAGVSRPPDEPIATPAARGETPPLPGPAAHSSKRIPTLPAAPRNLLAGPAPPVPGIPKWAMIGASIIIVLLAAGGAYYWQSRAPGKVEAEAPPPVVQASDAPSSPATLGLGGLSVPDVLARAPDVAAITAEGERRLHSDRGDDGLLLLEAAADRVDPGASAALAGLYDPVLFQPGGVIPRPDPRQAARYYRDAVRGGADVAAAREALRQYLQTRVQAGDLGANLSLKDFWP